MKYTQTMRLLLLVIISLTAYTHSSGQIKPPTGMGNACKFTTGTRAGQTQDYSQLGVLPLGSPCQDGQGSTGTVVALEGSGISGPSPGGPPQGMGNACKFNSGPRAGQTQDYSQLQPLPLGSPCQDGQSPLSTGVVVALGSPTPSTGGPPQGMGNACKFTAGPRAGQTQDYSRLGFLPLGSPCTDGQFPASTGVVVALVGGEASGPSPGGPPQGMGNACKFNAGPRAGQTQDYSQFQPLPLGSPCQDGQSPLSTGTVVALNPVPSVKDGNQTEASAGTSPSSSGKSRSCMLVTGPKAGSKESFPFALTVGMPCLTQSGVGIIVK